MASDDKTQLLRQIEEGQVGFNATLQGPYGVKKGRSLFWLKISSVIFFIMFYSGVY